MSDTRTNIYFASDFHLGVQGKKTSKDRELQIVQWLKSIERDCAKLFLVGDVFDYWFEYKHTIPKGYTRLLGQLATMTDNGVEVHFFVGNHDMWVKNYFTEELNINVHFSEKEFNLLGKSFLIGHGDGLGPGDRTYKLIKKILRNPFLQWCFSILHPTIGLALMRYFSNHSRDSQDEEPIQNIQDEWLVKYCEDQLKTSSYDFFIFGHRHKAIDYTLSNQQSRYINLGEWLEICSYGVWDGTQFAIEFYGEENKHKAFIQ